MANLERVLGRIDADLDASLARLFELLRFPSVGADPAHWADCAACAEWLAATLRSAGLETIVHQTPGRPIVLGHDRRAGPAAPTVLFYGHYDVQPAGPREQWRHGPFSPTFEGEGSGRRIIARGASDDKGQLMTFVEALHAYARELGRPPVNVTVLLEGEEEGDSASLAPFIRAHKEQLAAEVALICDTGLWAGRPCIVTMLRGLMSDEVVLHGAAMDLHSGSYGSAAVNPIHVLCRILAELRGSDGRVTIPGFYDGVEALPPTLRASWDGLGFDGTRYLADIGLSVPAGEQGLTVLEQIWARPTCEVNGIQGGYMGEGGMTVIPARASAKLSFRLVGRQDPEAIRHAFRDFVRARLPADMRAEFIAQGGDPACSVDTESRWFRLADACLAAEWGAPVAYTGDGGSIPAVAYFRSILNFESILTGFSAEDDLAHSPNEKYAVASFHKGVRTWARVLDAYR